MSHPLESYADVITEYWRPTVIEEIDEYFVKLAKLKGSLTWHSHPEQDELFVVIKGSLKMEYKDKTLQLNAGDLHVVPKGKMHNPVADEECLVLLIEHKSTEHTGDIKITGTRTIAQQLNNNFVLRNA